ncbi:MAG: trehalose-phosphatase [Rhodothermales bacterium]
MQPPVADQPLLFLDYDGTLAPIVDDPMEAFPHPDVPELLRQLDARYPMWIITGRFLDDVEQLVDGPYRAIGLHGIQRGRLGGEKENVISEEARRAIDALRETVPEHDGLRVEPKGPMFAVHYRLADDKQAARTAIAEWLSDVPDVLDPIWGKDVVELRPHGVSKGTAVRDVAARHPDRTPVYLGDDVTDEDAFRALGDEAITVKVGEGETVARYRLPTIEDVVEYLARYT